MSLFVNIDSEPNRILMLFALAARGEAPKQTRAPKAELRWKGARAEGAPPEKPPKEGRPEKQDAGGQKRAAEERPSKQEIPEKQGREEMKGAPAKEEKMRSEENVEKQEPNEEERRKEEAERETGEERSKQQAPAEEEVCRQHEDLNGPCLFDSTSYCFEQSSAGSVLFKAQLPDR